MTWIDAIRNKTDDEVWQWVGDHASKQAGPGVDGLLQKQVNLGLAELSLRSEKALRESIDLFRQSSDQYSRKLVRLTWALIILTTVLAVLALPPFVEWIKSLVENAARGYIPD